MYATIVVVSRQRFPSVSWKSPAVSAIMPGFTLSGVWGGGFFSAETQPARARPHAATPAMPLRFIGKLLVRAIAGWILVCRGGAERRCRRARDSAVAPR